MTKKEVVKELLRYYSVRQLIDRHPVLIALASTTKAKCFQTAADLVLKAIKKGRKRNEA
jgi:hypothetical protein